MLRIGVIGYGYWGPNVVRNFMATPKVDVRAVCDSNPNMLSSFRKMNPGVRTCTEAKDITTATDIDAVAIITPVFTHYALAKEALSNGKHIFIEKPFTQSVTQSEELIQIAAKKQRIIMVDHTFIFTSAVRKIKELITENALGKVFYYDSTRVNLGLFQHDVNVIWDLAPHDFSIMSYVLNEQPVAVSATGKPHINGLEDIAYIILHFSSNLIAHFNVNWLYPIKVRATIIGGEKKMLVYNDMEADEKIKVYDRGVELKTKKSIYKLLINYRSGDMWAPKLNQQEALAAECSYFVECVLKGKTPINDGRAGLQVVKMLSACDKSLKANGKMTAI